MHTFQPLSTDYLEFNPFTKIGKEWALLTAGTKLNANPMTISWGGMGVLWGKNVVFVFVRDSRYTKELLDKMDFFSLTFLDETYRASLNYCGSHSGREGNKWEGASLTMGVRLGIPYVDDGNLVLLCQKMSATRITEESFLDPEIKGKWYQDGDMHTMYVAEIIDVMAR
ncbi:MAG: flavin reductase family protein [Roseburia sp.]|nr:flavin reductase family protein [Roseburia sp.]